MDVLYLIAPYFYSFYQPYDENGKRLIFLFSGQRQRLRELLIRQQIQRNTLRQEKETAAAAAGAVGPPGSWGTEPSSPAFEQLSRGQTPFPGSQVGRLTVGGGSSIPKVAVPSSAFVV